MLLREVTEALQNSEAGFRAMFELSGVGMFQADSPACFTLHSPARISMRSGAPVTMQIMPRKDAASGVYMIGVRFGQTRARGPFLDAVKEAVVMPLAISGMLLKNIWDLITRKIEGGLTGPLGIAKEMAGAAKQGLLKFLEILILISVALGVFNLLPLPGLDGGRIFFVGISALRRKDVSPAIETKIHMIGIMVLLLLLVVVTFNDIKGIFFKKMG